MKTLIPNGGIPRSILFVMAVTGGLIFVVPLADKASRRKIVSINMSVAVACCVAIALARNIWIVWDMFRFSI